jgi:hypothetical protein
MQKQFKGSQINKKIQESSQSKQNRTSMIELAEACQVKKKIQDSSHGAK